jgi:fibronectin type 3 domain-containing protein
VVYEAPYPETEFRDVGLKPNTLYHYRIRTKYSDGTYSQYIPYGSSVKVRTSIPLTTSLWGFALGDSYIRLEWDASVLSNYTLALQRQDSDGNYHTIFSTKTADHYIDYGLTAGKAYFYRIYLYSDNSMSSPYSETVEVFTESIPAPSNCAALPMAGGQITVTWNYPYAVESGFEVFRKENDGPYERIAVLPKNSSSYQDHSAVYGNSYTYKVRAYRGSNVYSAFTTSPVVVTLNPLSPPSFS